MLGLVGDNGAGEGLRVYRTQRFRLGSYGSMRCPWRLVHGRAFITRSGYGLYSSDKKRSVRQKGSHDINSVCF